jgi:cytoskeletal protein CcmA (bactofilin family)
MKLGSSRRDFSKPAANDWQTRRTADDALDAEAPEDIQEAEPASYEYQPQAAQPAQFSQADRAEDCSSVIGAGSSWTGKFRSEESVRLDGKVSGEVKAAGTVHITQGAEVKATVRGKFVVVAGSFDGQLFCSERLELLPTSRVKGQITTKLLSVGEGAFIDGEVHMTDDVPDIASDDDASPGDNVRSIRSDAKEKGRSAESAG